MSVWVRRDGNPSPPLPLEVCAQALVRSAERQECCNYTMPSLKALQSPFPRLKLSLCVFTAGSPAGVGKTLKEKERKTPARVTLLLGNLPCMDLKCPHRTRGLDKQGKGQACLRAAFA